MVFGKRNKEVDKVEDEEERRWMEKVGSKKKESLSHKVRVLEIEINEVDYLRREVRSFEELLSERDEEIASLQRRLLNVVKRVRELEGKNPEY